MATGSELRLLDCLQLSDKGLLLLRQTETRRLLNVSSKEAGERALRRLGQLRNNLAHAQDIVSEDWEMILRLAEGLENIDPKQPYVIMTNHQSVIDIGAVIQTLPISFRFVAKKELTWIPIFGWALPLAGHVIIDRGERSKAVSSLQRAAQRISEGVNVIIFPEGTRSATGDLQPFKSGGFHLAIQAQVPFLPATISGTRVITPKRSLRVESGLIKIVYGKPIPTAGLSVDDRENLKNQVRRAIFRGFDWDLQPPPRENPLRRG